jgi:hypothetical protein
MRQERYYVDEMRKCSRKVGAVVMAMKRAAIDPPLVITMPGYFNGVWISEPRVLTSQPPPDPPSSETVVPFDTDAAELRRLASREPPPRVATEQSIRAAISTMSVRGVPGAVFGYGRPEWWGK